MPKAWVTPALYTAKGIVNDANWTPYLAAPHSTLDQATAWPSWSPHRRKDQSQCCCLMMRILPTAWVNEKRAHPHQWQIIVIGLSKPLGINPMNHKPNISIIDHFKANWAMSWINGHRMMKCKCSFTVWQLSFLFLFLVLLGLLLFFAFLRFLVLAGFAYMCLSGPESKLHSRMVIVQASRFKSGDAVYALVPLSQLSFILCTLCGCMLVHVCYLHNGTTNTYYKYISLYIYTYIHLFIYLFILKLCSCIFIYVYLYTCISKEFIGTP